MLKAESRGWVGSNPPRPGPHQEMHFTGGVCAIHAERVCLVDKISPFPPFLSLLRREKRNPTNLFTFPKCQDKLGGLRVGAQSSRQLFYKKSVRVDFSFARPLASPEETVAPPPRKTWTRLPPSGRAGPALGGTQGRPGHPAGPAAGALGEGSAPRPRRAALGGRECRVGVARA